jgi:type I restriction enzyme S subunit
MDWPLHKLEDLTERDRPITYGVVKPGPEDPENGVKFIRGGDIFEGKLAIESLRTITSDVSKSYRRTLLCGGELVVSLVGNPGHVAIVPKSLAGANLARQAGLVALRPNIDADFVKYFLMSPSGRADLFSQMTGSVQIVINLANLRTVRVPVPPLPIQRRIASILSAYDELIENSQRRIKILESMARALYREWFVHFRFPGRESLPLVPSPLGEIPQGWETCYLGEFVQFKSGFAFKSGTFTADGEHRLVTIKNVQDGSFSPESESRMSELPANLPPYCVLKDGEILLSLTGNVGRVCLVYDGPFLLNQRVSKLVPSDDFDWAMTYCMFRESEMRMKLEQLSNGVAQQNLSPVLASKMEFLRPPRELRQQFAELAQPMVQRIVQLFSTIQTLRRTRDLLLPRLLSGQIDVEAMPA